MMVVRSQHLPVQNDKYSAFINLTSLQTFQSILENLYLEKKVYRVGYLMWVICISLVPEFEWKMNCGKIDRMQF